MNQLPPNQMSQREQWQTQAEFAKSYTTPAVITLVLYFVLWVPGLIANIVYLVEANKTKRITGVNPDGYGCLLSMLAVVAGIPALLLLCVLLRVFWVAVLLHM